MNSLDAIFSPQSVAVIGASITHGIEFYILDTD